MVAEDEDDEEQASVSDWGGGDDAFGSILDRANKILLIVNIQQLGGVLYKLLPDDKEAKELRKKKGRRKK